MATHRLVLAAAIAFLAGCEPSAPAWGPSTLSYFEPAPEGQAWIRFDPEGAGEGGTKGRRAVLATVPGANARPEVAWRADGARAIVWMPGPVDENTGVEGPAKAWDVDLASGARAELAPPAGVTLEDVGFDAAGEVIALAETPWKESDEKLSDAKGRYRLRDGKRYDVPAQMEGLPILVHAFALTPERTWRELTTIVSDTGWDYAQGVDRLEVAQGLGARTSELLTSHPETTDLEDKAAIAAFQGLAPQTKNPELGQWAALDGAGGRVNVWLEQGGEFLHATDVLAFATEPRALVPHLAIPKPAEKAMVPPPGGTGARATALQVRGDRLLVADAHDGEHPRLLDIPSRTLVFSSDVARSATFWPAAGQPATATPAADATATAAP